MQPQGRPLWLLHRRHHQDGTRVRRFVLRTRRLLSEVGHECSRQQPRWLEDRRRPWLAETAGTKSNLRTGGREIHISGLYRDGTAIHARKPERQGCCPAAGYFVAKPHYSSSSFQFSRNFLTSTMNWSATAPSMMRWS